MISKNSVIINKNLAVAGLTGVRQSTGNKFAKAEWNL